MGPTWITCGLLWKKKYPDSNNWIWLLNIEYRKLAKQEFTTGLVVVTSCEGFGLHILMAVLVAKHSTAYCILIPGSRLALYLQIDVSNAFLQLYPLACHTIDECYIHGLKKWRAMVICQCSIYTIWLLLYEIEGLRTTCITCEESNEDMERHINNKWKQEY